MSAPQAVELTNIKTGEKHYFWSHAVACDFLGRSTAYMKRKIITADGTTIVSDANGEEFYCEEVGPGQRRDGVDKEGNKRKGAPPEIRYPFNYQLCTSCARAVGFCSWSDHLEPVEGWTAEPSVIKNHSKHDTDKDTVITETHGFRVMDCPLYICDGKTVEEQREQRKMLWEERKKKNECADQGS